MYIVLWDSLEEEYEFLLDAEDRAKELPGSEVIDLDSEEEELHW